MDDIYISSGPSASGDAESFELALNGVQIATLKRQSGTGDWVIVAKTPAAFKDVSFPGEYDEARACDAAKGWLEVYVDREAPDLPEILGE